MRISMTIGVVLLSTSIAYLSIKACTDFMVNQTREYNEVIAEN